MLSICSSSSTSILSRSLTLYSSSSQSQSLLRLSKTTSNSTPNSTPNSKPLIQTRHSHIGSSPLYIPASTTITILDVPPHPNKNRPLPTSLKNAKTIQIKGPKGQLDLPLHDCIQLNWSHSNSNSNTSSPSPSSSSSSSSASTSSSTTSTTSTTPTILNLTIKDSTLKTNRSLWGLSRALLSNAINGVSEGHSIILRMVGVGYRASIENIPLPPGQKPNPDPNSNEQKMRISLRLGYSHPILMNIPEGIQASTPQPTRIVLKGADKSKLGLFASQIRQWRKPEPYKGKGVFVGDETIKIKAAKKK